MRNLIPKLNKEVTLLSKNNLDWRRIHSKYQNKKLKGLQINYKEIELHFSDLVIIESMASTTMLSSNQSWLFEGVSVFLIQIDKFKFCTSSTSCLAYSQSCMHHPIARAESKPIPTVKTLIRIRKLIFRTWRSNWEDVLSLLRRTI